ncbi:MAG: serine/threonine-protein kinase [Hylemonella sp.]|nr:serine/threonine-protein kinase [Hylemonella sp.]
MADIPLDTDPPAVAQPAQPVVHLDALPPGTRLAEFELQDLLGVGGFGLVYRAYDHSLHRTVAIKEYMPSALAARQSGLLLSIRSSADQATFQTGLKSFVAEARLLAQFDHPSLVKVYRFWEANNTAYMVMPLYSGMTLKQARAQMPAPPPEDWLRTMLWSILQALQVLHEHDTLHRDVSPDNIFLQDVGPPVLLDLGAARRAISDRSRKLTAVLKVNYAPIEQYAEADDLKQGAWTDLYALAAVVYGCLRNDPPLPATTRVVSDSMPSVRDVAHTVKEHFGHAYSDAFVQTISHALSVQPAERQQSVPEFVREMGLQAPAGLGKFDWRSALGVDLLPDREDSSRLPWQTQPQTVSQAVSQTAVPVASTPPARHRRGRSWGVMAVAALLAAMGLYWGLSDEATMVAAPEPAPMPAPVVSRAPAPEPAASDPADPGPVAGQPEGPAPTDEVRSAPAPVAKTDRLAPAARPVARAPKPPGPKPLCADANFFSQPLCLFRECLKKENLNHPVCVESRRSTATQPSP